jgi:hypothetical protein
MSREIAVITWEDPNLFRWLFREKQSNPSFSAVHYPDNIDYLLQGSYSDLLESIQVFRWT